MSCGDCPGSNPGPCATFYVPLLPCPPDICPTRPCPAESPCEQCNRYDTGCSSWWCDRKKDKRVVHDDCWCNGWNEGDGYSRPKTTQVQSMYPKRPVGKPRLSYRGRLIQERVMREKLFPPPPPNICSFKPCIMEMIPPTWCNPTWNGIPQTCAKEPKLSYYEPGPCRRPGCLHISDVKPKRCCYDYPCKADCFEQTPCTKPTRYPRGYPHIC